MDRPRPLRRRTTALAIAGIVIAWPLAIGGFAEAAVLAPPAGVRAAPPAAPADAQIKLTLVASGLSSPVFVTSAQDGTGRLFIVEQTGRIRIYANGSVLSTPFLDLEGKVSGGSEQGLLGLAFHPNFETTHKLYVNYTNLAGDTIIREYRTYAGNPNRVNPATGRLILKIGQPYENHNGGMLAFGPDGFLYIGMGDGGAGGDPGNRAQNKESLLGKMLRIGINGTSGSKNYKVPGSNPYVGTFGWDPIWQIGLRNPWRWSFDRQTGDLWIGDVGQNEWEEVDRAPMTASGPGRGVNWGWNRLEGTHCYPPGSSCSTSGKKMPLAQYSHGTGRCAVTGGYVYRGSDIPALVGWYVYGDYCSGEIWVVAANATAPATPTRLLDTNLLISSFGETGVGELMVTDLGGRLYRLDQGP